MRTIPFGRGMSRHPTTGNCRPSGGVVACFFAAAFDGRARQKSNHPQLLEKGSLSRAERFVLTTRRSTSHHGASRSRVLDFRRGGSLGDGYRKMERPSGLCHGCFGGHRCGDRPATVFRGFVGERSSYAGFRYGELSWQCDMAAPVGINPTGCTRKRQ